jgi:hypothetical protein
MDHPCIAIILRKVNNNPLRPEFPAISLREWDYLQRKEIYLSRPSYDCKKWMPEKGNEVSPGVGAMPR